MRVLRLSVNRAFEPIYLNVTIDRVGLAQVSRAAFSANLSRKFSSSDVQIYDGIEETT